ncbi:hypothetical protein AEAC466_13535 [Asticcacaulis sp. AC466]|uniref:hypothetical protein n=1 Tax=Asticcacaulis sp. AC466 TaxID=1282362 RepID=UPI0003C3D2BB|nr:hypothetical protein [Asticcacaulis sp. AC466]ESQ83268.1 hypothetical protein AEAC466_13535 [Asticcacaulis sp. AC466]
MALDADAFGLVMTWLLTIAGAVIWAVRQEGRINLANEKIANLSDRLNTATAALARFDETTQAQVEEYRRHTDAKIDQLGASLSQKLERVFDKLDQKMDKT